MKQLSLFADLSETAFKNYLEKSVRKDISIVITDNSSIMLSFKTCRSSVSLRIHRMFLSAGREVLDELSAYIRNGRKKTPLIRAFIDKNIQNLKKKPPRRTKLVHRGRKFDLLKIFNSVNSEYFGGSISSSITWSSKSPKRSVTKRTLGSYSQRSDLIRINPVLDSSAVPRYFLEFVVYHEMLHAYMNNEPTKAGKPVHSVEYKKREKLFHYYDRAIAWEKKKWG
jgi:hypothetical protein